MMPGEIASDGFARGRRWRIGVRGPMLALLGLVSCAASSAATPTGPYWIVAGSFADPDYTQVQSDAVRRASADVARCGLEPFNDFSGKFVGFA